MPVAAGLLAAISITDTIQQYSGKTREIIQAHSYARQVKRFEAAWNDRTDPAQEKEMTHEKALSLHPWARIRTRILDADPRREQRGCGYDAKPKSPPSTPTG
jgi:hypothetical protein